MSLGGIRKLTGELRSLAVGAFENIYSAVFARTRWILSRDLESNTVERVGKVDTCLPDVGLAWRILLPDPPILGDVYPFRLRLALVIFVKIEEEVAMLLRSRWLEECSQSEADGGDWEELHVDREIYC